MASRRMMKIGSIIGLIILAMTTIATAEIIADFDDLSLPAESYWNGSDESGGFTSGDAYFVNNYNPDWSFWDGWAYSNMSDNTTPGPGNQYSAYTGAAHSRTIYGVAFDALAVNLGPAPVVNFLDGAYNSTIAGAYFTNTTYAALSMLNGDAYAKKFGGASGDDPDWFLLTIKGTTISGGYTESSVEFYLADYRFEDNSLDYIVDEWTWVALSGLGNVVGLEFTLSSSDSGMYGVNTPSYFAMDTVVPEPATVAFMALGALLLHRRKV